MMISMYLGGRDSHFGRYVYSGNGLAVGVETLRGSSIFGHKQTYRLLL